MHRMQSTRTYSSSICSASLQCTACWCAEFRASMLGTSTCWVRVLLCLHPPSDNGPHGMTRYFNSREFHISDGHSMIGCSNNKQARHKRPYNHVRCQCGVLRHQTTGSVAPPQLTTAATSASHRTAAASTMHVQTPFAEQSRYVIMRCRP